MRCMPPASIAATSPVRYQPSSVNTAAVASGRPRLAVEQRPYSNLKAGNGFPAVWGFFAVVDQPGADTAQRQTHPARATLAIDTGA